MLYSRVSEKLNNVKISEMMYGMLLLAFLVSTIWMRVLSNSAFSIQVAQFILIACSVAGTLLILKDFNTFALLYLINMILTWAIIRILKSVDYFYRLEDIIGSISFFCIAYIMYRTNSSMVISRLVYILLSIYFLIETVVLRTSITGLLADGNSYNYISCYMIVFFAIYSFTSLHKNHEPSIIDILLFITVCIAAYGRGGILSAAVYGIGYVSIIQGRIREKPQIFIITIFVIFLSLLFSSYIIDFFDMQGSFDKFEKLGLDSNGRFEIWSRYLQMCRASLYDFILGVDAARINVTANLHNSFLQMWSALGFVFFITNCLLIAISLAKKLANREYFFILVGIVFFVRAFTDKMMFRWYGEILMYYIIIDFFMGLKKNSSVPSEFEFYRDR